MNNVIDLTDNDNAKDANKERKGKGKGGFFAVEKPIVDALISQYGVDTAAAYIVLARYTDKTHQFSSAGVNAIEKHTGIGRGAIKKILNDNLAGIVVDAGGTKRKPRRALKKYADIEQIGAHINKFFDTTMTPLQRNIYDLIRAGGTVRESSEKQKANDLVKNGWLKINNGVFSIKVDVDEGPEQELIWLPNEFVNGAGKETPPLELLRQTRDSGVFKLYLIFAYHHELQEHGGVDRSLLSGPAFKQKIWEHGEHDIYVFWQPSISTYYTKHPSIQPVKNVFWDKLLFLQRLGLIEWVWQLAEGREVDAPLIRPHGSYEGENPEKFCADYSEKIAALMMGRDDEEIEPLDEFYELDRYEGFDLVSEAYSEEFEDSQSWNLQFTYAAVPRHYSDVQMVKVVRLKYRPNTQSTKSWWGKINNDANILASQHENLLQERGLKGGKIKVAFPHSNTIIE